MNRHLPLGLAGACPLTTRERLELEIERLIALLDELDGDPDIEPNGDEMDQSVPMTWTRQGFEFSEDQEPGDDDEPFNPVTLNPPHHLPAKRIRRKS